MTDELLSVDSVTLNLPLNVLNVLDVHINQLITAALGTARITGRLTGVRAVVTPPVAAGSGPNTVKIGTNTFPLAGTDIPRGSQQLVRYTAAAQTVTPTNQYGVEVVVNSSTNVVSSVNDRLASGDLTGTTIPAGSYVLSGHGATDMTWPGLWLRTYATVGVTIQLVTTTFVSVPNIVGLTESAATSALTTAGLTAGTRMTTSSQTVAAGSVSGQSPAAGVSVASGSAVTYAVSTGATVAGGGTTGTAPQPFPAKAVGVYKLMWPNSPAYALGNLPPNVNVVYLAFAQGDPPTIVGWSPEGQSAFLAAASAARARGVRIILSVGGAGGALNPANRTNFVNGVMAINSVTPLDGLDWDIETTSFTTADVLAICQSLKAQRGSNFAITMPPSGGSPATAWRATAVTLQANNCLDFTGQQYYDYANVALNDIQGSISALISAGIPQSKIGIGMMPGRNDSAHPAVSTYLSWTQTLKSQYPNLAGGYLWEASNIDFADWANRVGAVLLS